MRKKIMVLAMTVMLAGLTACGGDKKEKKTESDGAAAVTVADEKEGAEEKDKTGAEDEFSGDWSAAEEAGYPPFWLKYGPKNLEKKDLSDVELYGCFTDGTPLKDIISNPKFTYCKVTGAGQELEIEDMASFLASPTDADAKGSGFEIYLYEEKDGDPLFIHAYVLGEESKTFVECVEENQFIIGDCSEISDENYADLALGIPNCREGECTIDSYIQLGELLGKPDKIYGNFNMTMLTDRKDGPEETFAETVQLGGGGIHYDMMYKMNHGMLFVGVAEANLSEKYKSTEDESRHILAEYCSSEEMYIYLRDETNSGEIVHEDYEYNFE